MTNNKNSTNKQPLALYFQTVGGEGCDLNHGDPYGFAAVSISSKPIRTYAKGSVVYVLDEEYVKAIKEQIEIEKDSADDPQDVDVFYVFDIEELVFKTRFGTHYKFNTIVFPDGTTYTRKGIQK